VGSPTSASFTNNGLTNGTNYFYVITALKSGLESENSAEVTAKPAAVIVPPAAPTNVVAKAGDASVSLTWTSVSGATLYSIKRALKDGGPYEAVGSVASTNFDDTGLSNGTAYYYVVSAQNAGGKSVNSEQVIGTPKAALHNYPPVMSIIAPQTMYTNDILAVSFAVSDAETTSGDLQVSATSSNPALDLRLNVGGEGDDRFIKIISRSDQSGSTMITISVSDGVMISQQTFALSVNARPQSTALLEGRHIFKPSKGEAGTIHLNLPRAEHVQIFIVSRTGEKITDLLNSDLAAGDHAVSWDGKSASSGVYMAVIITEDGQSREKLVLVR
jgi:hypothetical protein